jgi:energy-coupling factor transport system permease protein
MREWIKDRLSKITVEGVKLELLRTAYGNQSTLIARTDPRALMVWYLFFALAPWFTFDEMVLGGLLIVTVVVAFIARVSKLIVILLIIGVISQILGYGIFALIMGGNWKVFLALSTLILKLVTISVASIAVFASMDPERFSDALVSVGMNGRIAFGVSYAYRIAPVLLEEYNNIINSYRLRSKAPKRGRFFYIRYAFYLGRLAVRSFYPMMLNTAKRTRTTVEGLEVKGFTYSLEDDNAKRLKLSYLQFRSRDAVFLFVNALAVAAVFTAARFIPL